MQFRKQLLLGAVLSAVAATSASADGQITIIQTGDFHGHLTDRPNLRSNSDGHRVGGLARIKTKIQEIQAGKGGAGNTLVMHTGDTIQGSGEALYTRGQALVDVVDMLGIDAYAPGNWDFVYGPDRFKELFATGLNPNMPSLPEQVQGKTIPPPVGTRWGGLVSNLYVTSPNPSAPERPSSLASAQGENVSAAEYSTWANWYVDHGQRVLPPYRLITVNGVKVGIVGCTTSRGPQVVGSWVTTGLEFTDCSREVPKFVEEVRAQGAELVVLISEIEIGRNIRILKDNITKAEQHVDVVLNSDMHEETIEPIEVIDGVGNKTWILEDGQDGTLINEITLSVHSGQVTGMDHTAHRIDDTIPEDVAVAAKVAEVRAPFNEGFTPNTYVNPFSGTYLNGPLNEVVGSTDIALHRNNYSHEEMAAVVEGSSHDFVADAIRWWAKSDLATVRGFRFGTHVAPGPITRNDLFHYVPIGPRVGKASRIAANQLRNQIDNSSLAVFSSDPNTPVIELPRYNNTVYTYGGAQAGNSPGAGLPAYGLAGAPNGWGGGWLFAYSGDGFHMNFAPYYNINWQHNADNTITAAPPTNTSRARALTIKALCKQLPPAEITSTGCSLSDTTTRYTTVITTANDGVYTGPWKANYTAAQINANYSGAVNNASNCGAAPLVACGYTPYLLNPDGWTYLNGTPNQPKTNFTVNQHFKAGLFTVAGYWYAQSPNTINNCNNCYPTGTSTVVGNANAAYLLPVNAKADGTPALDANGDPLFVRDGSGNVIMENGKPKIEGEPIDLTMIIEKYLASLGTVNASNLTLNRIGLVNNDGSGPISLPDFTSTLGFPVMQPLCGTLGKTAASTVSCP